MILCLPSITRRTVSNWLSLLKLLGFIPILIKWVKSLLNYIMIKVRRIPFAIDSLPYQVNAHEGVWQSVLLIAIKVASAHNRTLPSRPPAKGGNRLSVIPPQEPQNPRWLNERTIKLQQNWVQRDAGSLRPQSGLLGRWAFLWHWKILVIKICLPSELFENF